MLQLIRDCLRPPFDESSSLQHNSRPNFCENLDPVRDRLVGITHKNDNCNILHQSEDTEKVSCTGITSGNTFYDIETNYHYLNSLSQTERFAFVQPELKASHLRQIIRLSSSLATHCTQLE